MSTLEAEDIFYKPFYISAEAIANILKIPSDCMSTKGQCQGVLLTCDSLSVGSGSLCHEQWKQKLDVTRDKKHNSILEKRT